MDSGPASASAPRRALRTRWRKLFRALHRDLGYTAVALTLAYSVSGIAVNHIEDWNPNYAYDVAPVALGPLPVATLPAREAFVVARLGIPRGEVRGHIQENPRELRVFLEGGAEVRVDMLTGAGTHSTITRRPVFFQVNALHLNNLKGAWTYIADLFALALVVLALTGLTMMKGDRGLGGRGKWFVMGGLAIPLAAIAYLYT